MLTVGMLHGTPPFAFCYLMGDRVMFLDLHIFRPTLKVKKSVIYNVDVKSGKIKIGGEKYKIYNN